ncbi:MAG: Hsp20/alpha crystallin family protein [Actinomycetota bacterium]
MSLVRWSPLTLLPFRGWFSRGWLWDELDSIPWFGGISWWPSMDVYSEKGDMVIKMELPDMNPEDIQIDLSDGHLTISGRHEREEREEDKNYFRRERFSGSFTRHIPLPREVKESDITARLKKGVLEVRVKGVGKEIGTKKRIPIEAS